MNEEVPVGRDEARRGPTDFTGEEPTTALPSNPPSCTILGSNIQLSVEAGDQNNPINVDDRRQRGKSDQAGDWNHPITVEESGDLNQPIYVDEYDDDDVEVVELERISFLQNPIRRKGKKPIYEYDDDDLYVIKIESFMQNPIGRKGKTYYDDVCESSSSRGRREPDEVFCSICMESKLSEQCFSMMGCSHMYCNICVSQYVAAKIEDGVISIGCPDPGCKDGFLAPEMCRVILPQEVFSWWGHLLCEAWIAATSMKFYCPYKDCSALLIDEGGQVIRESICPHCQRLFCAHCKVPWHGGFNCEEFGKLGADERETEDLMLMEMAKKQYWKRCPKCKYFVEKISGCNFIKCRCGFRFCYHCTTEMAIDHYCSKCRR